MVVKHKAVCSNCGLTESEQFWKCSGNSCLCNECINEIEVLLSKGGELFEREKYEDAIVYFDKALKINPVYVKTLRMKAGALNNLGLFQRALIYIDKMLEINPADKIAQDMKSRTLKNSQAKNLPNKLRKLVNPDEQTTKEMEGEIKHKLKHFFDWRGIFD